VYYNSHKAFGKNRKVRALFGESKKRLNLRLPLVPVITACRLLLPQITAPIYRLKCPERWKMAFSLNTFSATQFVPFKFSKNDTAKCIDNFFVLGCCVLHYLLSSNELAEFCALSIVHAPLSDTLSCSFAWTENKMRSELHSPQLQWVVDYWGLSLYKCNQSHWTTYAACRWTFSLVVFYQTSYEMFAL
jgi:hypothetical protein